MGEGEKFADRYEGDNSRSHSHIYNRTSQCLPCTSIERKSEPGFWSTSTVSFLTPCTLYLPSSPRIRGRATKVWKLEKNIIRPGKRVGMYIFCFLPLSDKNCDWISSLYVSTLASVRYWFNELEKRRLNPAAGVRCLSSTFPGPERPVYGPLWQVSKHDI